LFWNVSSLTFRILEFVMWAVGIYLIVRVLIKAYDWMRGDTFMLLRLDYLRELKNPKDMEEPWRSVWEAKNITTQNEKEFFTIFSAAIDNLLKK